MNENEISKNSESTRVGENLKNIRTYQSDVADVLAKRNTSAVTIALAESRKNRDGESFSSNEDSSQIKKKVLIVVICVVLAAAGVFGAYYLYSISPLAPTQPKINTPQSLTSLIPIDSQSLLNITNATPVDVRMRVKNELLKNQAPGTIRELVMVSDTTITSGPDAGTKKASRIPSQTMISNMGIGMPDILYRSLTADWMLGVYSNKDEQKSVFVIIKNNFFQNTFAGMLQWENIMADDLKDFLISSNVNGIANKPVTNESVAPLPTSSSTIEQYAQVYTTIRGRFIDKILKNKDIREFVSIDGEIIFLYSFLDNNSLIFTSDESLVTDIMSRLEKQSFMR